MRDIVLADTVYLAFTTRAFATGIPTTLAGTPVVSAYEDAGLVQITAGITLGIDHDGVTGLHMLTIVATGANGFEADKDYNLVITTGTVGGVSVVGEVVAQFSIQRAPVNWANIADPTTAVDLAGTDIQLVDTATVLTGKTGFSLTTADWNVGKTGYSLTATTGLGAQTANITGNLSGSVGSVTGAVGSVTGNTNQTGDTYALANGTAGFVAIDTVVDAVKVVTDKFAFTVANQVDANAQYWNDTAISTALETAVDVRTEMDSNSTRLATLAGGIIEGATAGTPTSTSTNTDLTGYLDSELVGRLIVFTGGTANGQAATILTYTATSGVVTFAALTTAPAASDSFKIV